MEICFHGSPFMPKINEFFFLRHENFFIFDPKNAKKENNNFHHLHLTVPLIRNERAHNQI